MLSRERVMAALDFEAPDVVPLQIFAAPGGLHEHGQKLADLVRECGHDFGDLSSLTLPEPPRPEDFDPDGRYHAIRTDEWGTTWEYRIFGIWGHTVQRPLDDLAHVGAFRPPGPPALEGPAFESARVSTAQNKQRYFSPAGGGSLFEKLCSLRRFEDVLMDVLQDTPEINRIEDKLVEHAMGLIRHGLALDADALCFGDDFGTQQAPIFPPRVWRRFFKPRYRSLFEPVRRAGKKILFHSCGQIGPLLEDFAELGVNAIWPQLPLFDQVELAGRCRDLGLAVQLHPDRGDLMQRGQPQQVKDYVRRLLDNFGAASGGSWLYIEIDPGFPWANVAALLEIAMELRSRGFSRG